MATAAKASNGVAVVFGGSRGIGAACVRLLAQEGWKTVAVGRSEERLRWVAEEAAAGKLLHAQICDVTNDGFVNETVKAIEKDLGPIEVAVNSAGISLNKLLIQTSSDEVRAVLDTNLIGSIYTSKAVLRQMLRRRSGSIVNVGSVVGRHGNPGQAIYAASKAALVGFTKSLAKEVASKGIRVNIVSPGLIDTDMISSVDVAPIERQIALGRIGQVDEVAKVITFLATKASYVTGQEVPVCGGLDMRM